MIEQRQRIRNEDRGAKSLTEASEDEKPQRRRDRAGERSQHKDGEAEDENFFGAEPVAERAGGQNERREGDRVGIDDPLQVGERTAIGRADAVDRDIDDGDVELHDHITQTHRRERQWPCQRRRAPARGRGLVARV
jgi:hypothetical protein